MPKQGLADRQSPRGRRGHSGTTCCSLALGRAQHGGELQIRSRLTYAQSFGRRTITKSRTIQAQIEDTRHPSTSVNGDVEEAAFRRRGALTPAHWPDLSPLPPARHSPPAQDRFPQLTPEPPHAHSGLGILELSLRDAQPRTSSFFVVFTRIQRVVLSRNPGDTQVESERNSPRVGVNRVKNPREFHSFCGPQWKLLLPICCDNACLWPRKSNEWGNCVNTPNGAINDRIWSTDNIRNTAGRIRIAKNGGGYEYGGTAELMALMAGFDRCDGQRAGSGTNSDIDPGQRIYDRARRPM
ncbi:hypothetical protein FB45DRAFT_1113857 [Roridomyces roridus]|uniref:Uncharacterized protein n=1 Tax=Roridomyces roridus TaxID=1738132 RepID=A0AAD7CA48_9AGAR|nr:hypothetical protein FB45DRAFT_1113857 [Roridomyces roridus]